ncbi:MAG: nucleotidyltransferase [Candidatus Wallbacteria bacterium]|nr:nucleotidyltransferase [Candidatus Wallbacteria bacterium]
MDTESLLRSLKDHNVRFVVIGAFAFPVHGYSRATLDIDIFIESAAENAGLCREALIDFGYDLSDVSAEEILTRKILIRQYLVETDIHPFVAGVTFEEVWKNKVTGKFGEVEAYFASLDDLIRMKKAAGRPKDIADLEVLSELKKRSAPGT